MYHEKDKEKMGKMDEVITIKITPRKIVRAFCLFAVLLLVFYLGRFSVDPPDFSGLTIFSDDSNNTEDADTSVDDQTTEVEASDDNNGASVETAAVETSTDAAEVTAGETAAETSPASESAPEETIENLITSYGKISVALTGVKKTWLGTWGKITDLDFVVKNSDTGTIKMDHFIMSVEGYDDFEKKIPISKSIQVLKGGTRLESKVRVPNGFAYNEITAGDLKSVSITLALYDGSDKIISTFTSDFNIQG